jgi:hypothetical protein
MSADGVGVWWGPWCEWLFVYEYVWECTQEHIVIINYIHPLKSEAQGRPVRLFVSL